MLAQHHSQKFQGREITYKVRVYHNGDDVFIAWKPEGFIPFCRGFALLRKRNGLEEVVRTWVGFEDDEHEEGERRASINWPIQKYQWTDYMANLGDKVQYRVLPMVGADKRSLRPDSVTASEWTPEIILTHMVTPQIEAYFNRGIVAAQWISRRLASPSRTRRRRSCGRLSRMFYGVMFYGVRRHERLIAA